VLDECSVAADGDDAVATDVLEEIVADSDVEARVPILSVPVLAPADNAVAVGAEEVAVLDAEVVEARLDLLAAVDPADAGAALVLPEGAVDVVDEEIP
jgi:hypothetical protein